MAATGRAETLLARPYLANPIRIRTMNNSAWVHNNCLNRVAGDVAPLRSATLLDPTVMRQDRKPGTRVMV